MRECLALFGFANGATASSKMMTIIFISPLDVSLHTIHFDWVLRPKLSVSGLNTPIHYVRLFIVFSCFSWWQIIVFHHIFRMISNTHRNGTLVCYCAGCRNNVNAHKASAVTLCYGQIQPHIYVLQIRFASFVVPFPSFCSSFRLVCRNACTCLSVP